MIIDIIEPDWVMFAESIHATTTFQKETSFNRDNIYTIEVNGIKVQLVWGTQPEVGRAPHVKRETLLHFQLIDSTISLKVYPKDFLSTITSFFTTNKVTVEYPEVGKSFLFISNSKELIDSVSNDLKVFFQARQAFDFFINTENDKQASTLIIQLNELLIAEKDLIKFYTLGLSIAKKMNREV